MRIVTFHTSWTSARELENAATAQVCLPQPETTGMLRPPVLSGFGKAVSCAAAAGFCLSEQSGGRLLCPGSSICASRLDGVSKNDICQYLHLRGESQLSPTPPADVFRLVDVSLSRID